MTAAQSFKIYETLGKHFTDNDEAITVVTEIEQIIETKLNYKKDVLVTKEDLLKMQMATNEDILKLHVDIEKALYQLTIWIASVFIA